VQRFKRFGAAGLKDSPPRSGRPSKLNPAQKEKMKAFVAKAHAQSQGISGGILAAFIKESFGVTLTRRQCERILKGLTTK